MPKLKRTPTPRPGRKSVITASASNRSQTRGYTLLAASVLLATSGLRAQAPHPLTDADKSQIDALIAKMSSDQKLAYIGGTGFAVRAVPELNLPALEMSDGPVGVRSNAGSPSTTYAGGIGLAATWDSALAAKIGAGIGRDARARGVNYMLGPGVNIYRSPRNGRNFEYFGEDPFLAGKIAVGYITGMQTQGVSSTVKHFLANNSEYLRHDSDSMVDERALREIYLPAFEAAVKVGHVGAVMDSYNLINGTHATANGYFNTEILRNEWHFPGTLMSDWVATYDAVGAANGGLDIEMPTGAFMNKAKLAPAIAAGTVKQATIDEKVRHILTTAMMFDWLKRDQRDPSISVFNAESNATALQSARESPVLLKNEGNLLPLSKTGIKTVLLVGPNVYPGTPVGGGSAGVVPFHNTSLLEGVSNVATNVNILYDAGLPTLSELAGKTDFMTAESGGKPGLTDERFASKDLTGPSHQTTVKHVNVAGVGWDAISGNLDDILKQMEEGSSPNISHRYTGYYNAAASGPYLLALTGGGESNGDRVTIDGKVVIDDWTLVKAFEPHLTMPLSAGMHKVVVETWQNGPVGGQVRFAIAPESTVVNERAKQLAAKADVVIVAAGYSVSKDGTSESEGGDRTFDLPFGQDALISAMTAANPKTVVAVTSGGNVETAPWIEKVPAYIEAWYGGQSGGQALAEILFGDTNPSGHLPATFERRLEDNPTFADYYPAPDQATAKNPKVYYREGIFVGYRGYEKNGVKPLFPFGFGLSYTTFTFANLKVTPGSGAASATIDFDITNSGQRSGADVAQVYVSDTHARVPRPAHELKGFARVDLAAGATQHVSIPLDARAFAYYDVSGKHWTIDPGAFTISVGDSLASLPLTSPLSLTREAVRNAIF